MRESTFYFSTHEAKYVLQVSWRWSWGMTVLSPQRLCFTCLMHLWVQEMGNLWLWEQMHLMQSDMCQSYGFSFLLPCSFFFKWMAPIPKKGSHSIFYGVQWAPVKWAYQNCSFSKFYNLKTDFMCLHFLKVTCLSSCPGTTSKIWLFEEKTSACVLTWVALDSSRVYC